MRNCTTVVKRHCAVLLFQLVLVCSVQAEINWRQVEALDTQVNLAITKIAVASDGALWRTYSTPSNTYIERIDLQTGALLGSMQLNATNVELLPDSTTGSMWLVRDFTTATLVSSSLKTLETRPGVERILPGCKTQYFGNIFTPGILKPRPINPPGTYFGSASSGLWSSFNSSIAKINLDTGTALNSIPLSVSGCLNFGISSLNATRALSNNCLINVDSGQVLRVLTSGSFEFNNTQLKIDRNYAISNDTGDIRIYAADTGAELWTIPRSYPDQKIQVGETLAIQSNSRLLGYNISDGTPLFNVAMTDPGYRKISATATEILINRPGQTEIYSPQSGLLLRSIPANSVQPAATTVHATYTDDSVYLSSLFLENSDGSFIQITKRALVDGSIMWRKSFQYQFSAAPICQDTCSSLTSVADDAILAVSATIKTGATTNHSIVWSLNPNTGAINWRKDLNDVLDQALISATGAKNGTIQAVRTAFPGHVTTSEFYDAISGNLLWSHAGTAFMNCSDGDPLFFRDGLIDRIDIRSGQVKWQNRNAAFDTYNLISVTPFELIYRDTSTVWEPLQPGPISIRKLSLATGGVRDVAFSIPEHFDSAYSSGYSVYALQRTIVDSVIGIKLYPELRTGQNSLLIDKYESHKVINIAGGLIMRRRGLGTSFSKNPAAPYWMNEVDFNGQLNFWQALPRPQPFGKQRTVSSYMAETISADRVFIEQDYNEIETRYFISRVSSIDAPESKVSLKISKRFTGISNNGEYRYLLRVENIGTRSVVGASLHSTYQNSNSVNCTAIRGSCSPTSRLGSVNLQLDLLPGGIAELAVLDISPYTNTITVMAPSDAVEPDISDNFVDLDPNIIDPAEFTDGFE